jgi:proteasome lid subunit RPN8/RPN11
MMQLWLTEVQAKAILDQAREEAPREACGLIAGVIERGVYRAVEIIPVANAAPDPLHLYHMDERELARQLTRLYARGLSLIGLYHSHPAGDPIPSPVDIAQAAYPDTACLIAGLRRGELAAWEIAHGQVRPISLHIGSQPPPPTDALLSRAQQTAIIAAAVLAFALLIVISLSLLPPAPPIPP